MKHQYRLLVAILFCCLVIPGSFAQDNSGILLGERPSPPVPRQFHYQGCLTNPQGVKYEGTYRVKFEIVDLDTSPLVVLFSETVNALSVSKGLFEHAIGSVDTTNNKLNPLIFQKRCGLRLTVGNEVLDPPIPIYPAPIAMVALYADSLKQPLPPGPQGPPGPPGQPCWDLNGNGLPDLATEDLNGDLVVDVLDCQGEDCWDLNGNGRPDPLLEDVNGDGVVDVLDCQGPPGPPGVPDTLIKIHIDTLIVLKKSEHYGWEHFREGISVGGQDSTRRKMWIDKDGEVYARSLHVVDTAGKPITTFDSTGSTHNLWEHYRDGISVGGNLPTSQSTVLTREGVNTRQVQIVNGADITGIIDSTGEAYLRSFHVVKGDPTDPNSREEIISFDSTASVHRVPEFYIDPKSGDTTYISGGYISTPLINGKTVWGERFRVAQWPTGSTVARIDPDGEAYFKSLHIVKGDLSGQHEQIISFDSSKSVHKVTEFYIAGQDTTLLAGDGLDTPGIWIWNGATREYKARIDEDGEGYFSSLHVGRDWVFPDWWIDKDGRSYHGKRETFIDTIFVPLENGNFLTISPLEGIAIKSPTGQWVSHLDPNGNFLATGAKNNIVPTKSYGTRRMYATEAPEVWYQDRGQARLTGGETKIALDPMFLETVTIDADHPMLVKITPTGECNGLYVAEKGSDYFVVRELMKGTSSVTFDWEVSIKRSGYEDIRMEPYEDAVSTDELRARENVRLGVKEKALREHRERNPVKPSRQWR